MKGAIDKMIRFENVSKQFDSEGQLVEAVKDVSIHLDKGRIYGIIGFSGAGKSTLVRCINLLERPTKGKVYIEGTEITGLSERKLREQRKKIGMIFQHFNLFASRTVSQNIAYPLRNSGLTKIERKERVDELLNLVGLVDKAKVYPSQLSGGQKQRVAIARALANDPQILLSDESTSSLDPQTTKSILNLLKELNEKLKITVVVITHEMQIVKEICDWVYVMEEGEVVEEGDVFQVFAKPQRQITKDFVASTSNLWKINELIEKKVSITQLEADECIMKFKYMERNTSEALVSHISREYNLDVNIIFGNVDLIGGCPIGGLVSIVKGDSQKIKEAILFLESKQVEVEVILNA